MNRRLHHKKWIIKVIVMHSRVVYKKPFKRFEGAEVYLPQHITRVKCRIWFIINFLIL